MNSNDFTGFITGKKVAGESEISGIREMITLFPWFHSAYLVLLKTLLENSDVKFDSQLRQSSIYVSDRSMLYNYLYLSSITNEAGESTDQNQLAGIKEGADQKQLPEIQESQTEIIPEEIIIRSPSATEETEKPLNNIIQAPEGEMKIVTRSREELISEIEARLKDLDSALNINLKTDSGIVAEPVSPNKADNEERVPVTDEDILISEPASDAVKHPSGDELLTVETDTELPVQPDEAEIVQQPASIDLNDLLEIEKEEDSGLNQKAENENIAPDEEGIVQAPDGYVIDIEETKKLSEEEEKQLSQDDLINRFIESNPRLERIVPGESNEVIDLSADSSEIKNPFITETLAKIYINQGYYSKAINIYEKLTLQYPEKSAYFASRIEKIKDLIK